MCIKTLSKQQNPSFRLMSFTTLWTKIHLAYQKLNLSIALDDAMEVIIADFKQTIFKYKSGQIHTTFEGYFYTVVYSRLWHLQKQENSQLWYDQLVSNDPRPSSKLKIMINYQTRDFHSPIPRMFEK